MPVLFLAMAGYFISKSRNICSSHIPYKIISKIDPRQIPLKFLNRDDQSTFLVTFIENLEPRITKAGHNVGLKMRPNS